MSVYSLSGYSDLNKFVFELSVGNGFLGNPWNNDGDTSNRR